ncbi:hypothetical protein TNCT_641551 [Trichonephila clavata]|uniref:Uncharacterized protein n=1 Tax=Trichonephila clavata TaxID=2740835 RepID=A0A8X6LYP3_TRICU|nr:hypothetical protein TNCT_641551 [Trichonephila clavata]
MFSTVSPPHPGRGRFGSRHPKCHWSNRNGQREIVSPSVESKRRRLRERQAVERESASAVVGVPEKRNPVPFFPEIR